MSDRRRWRPRAPRVATVLVVVAFIPLLGTSLIVWSDVSDARAVADAGAETERLAELVADLSALDASVVTEATWTGVTDVADIVEVPPLMLGTVLGGDPFQRRADAIERTDELVDAAGVDGIDADLERARAEGIDLSGRLVRYDAVISAIDGRLADTLARLGDAAARAGGDTELAAATRQGLLARGLRSSVVDGFFGYFASVFDLRDRPAVEVASLARTRSRYERDAAALLDAAASDPAKLAAVEAIVLDPELTGFMDAIDDLIERTLATGAPEQGVPLTVETMIAEGRTIEVVFVAATIGGELTSELVDVLTTAVVETAGEVRRAAENDIRRAYLVAAGMIVATLVAAVLAARFIVAPLGALRRSADLLRVEEEGHVAVGGPAEVRAAGEALDDASAHLRLVTVQAQALAAGELDAPALESPAPGGLGWALQEAVGTLRGALARQEDYRAQLVHEASHDGLTQIPNRTASVERLQSALARAARSQTSVGVLFIDLDRFKDVNDTHGHRAGDDVLMVLAERLQEQVREGDLVGRLGGDEFVVVAEPVGGVDDAVELAERVHEAVTTPIPVTDGVVSVGASIGVAVSEPDETSADRLLHLADLAAYSVKERRTGGVRVCDERFRAEVANVADLTEALHDGVGRGELRVHYQPIVDAADRTVRGLEALVRWRRPGHGLLAPGDFIEVAERGSLIIDVDRWVVDAVARQLAAWSEQGVADGLRVAINVSGRHLAHPDVVDHVLAPLVEHEVDPSSLVVEVTESAVLDDLVGCAAKLQRLRDAGVAVSVDDFGIGHTSLSSLRSLPIDVLKIDRSFTSAAVRRRDDASIVRSIIETGHALGAAVTAEGIEDEETAAAMVELGADALQGFHVGRPVEVDELDLPASVPERLDAPVGGV